MPNPKPTSVMAWATTPPAGALLEPSSALVSNGYSQNSKPAYNTFNWLLSNIGQWLAYLSTLDQSFTWQNNGLFSADPTIFGPAGTAADGSDARVQNVGAYSGFALYYSPLGPMPAGPCWNAFYNDGGANFLPYKAGTPAFRSFLDPATSLLRFMASGGAAALGTALEWTDALAVTPGGKVLVNRTLDDGTGSSQQVNGAVSGFSFYALPVGPSLDFFGFGWNCFFNPQASTPQYFSNEPAFWLGWIPAGVSNGASMMSALFLRMGPGGANTAGTDLFPTSNDTGPAIAFTPDGRMFVGDVNGGFFTDDGSGAKIQVFGGLSVHGDVAATRVLAGTADDKTGASLQGKAISEAGQLLANRYLGIVAQAADSAKLGGQAPAYFLPATAQAADSAKLGGQLPAYYLPAGSVAENTDESTFVWMGINGVFALHGSTVVTTDASGNVNVNFPQAFPTAAIGFFGGPGDNNAGGFTVVPNASTLTKTGVSVSTGLVTKLLRITYVAFGY